MPNWCYNILNVSGSEDDVSRFVLAARGRTQTYNDSNLLTGEDWESFEDIRVQALFSYPPELGDYSVFSFHALVPVPDSVRRLPYSGNQARKVAAILGGNAICGYDWEVDKWGVKWGGSDEELTSREAGSVEYRFSTPWAPPNDFLKTVAADWAMLKFVLSYEEPGMDLRGEITCESGSVTSRIEEDFDFYDGEEDE